MDILANTLVKDVIKAIVNNEITVLELAGKYGVTDRTIQNKIKKMGFVWDSKNAKYDFVGENENVFNLTSDEAFKKGSQANNSDRTIDKTAVKKEAKTESKKASEEIATTLQTTPEINTDITSKNNVDNIDRLLAGKKPKKAYRGFYFDDDVLSIIDTVESGIKSELINECLRKVFREKGLL